MGALFAATDYTNCRHERLKREKSYVRKTDGVFVQLYRCRFCGKIFADKPLFNRHDKRCQVIRSLKVECLPCDLPQEFTLDVTQLGLAQSMRLSDIAIPNGIKPLGKMNEVAVVIAKKV